MAELILVILEKMLRYGPDVIIDIAKLWENGKPLPDQIRALKIDKDPEDYLND